ncbi:MAG: acyl-CoA synthetase (AMP-forming)/AMP-acid ligase II [Halioglobus sp.]|jgi:acyl-CoA synthetase (AMP-forming)/AMP-acid ligase II
MYIGDLALQQPDQAAYIMAASGDVVSYEQLNDRSRQTSQLFRFLGLQVGDHIAFYMENNARFLEICVAASRSGLFYTAISSRLTASEAAYIVNDCGARLFISSLSKAGVAVQLLGSMPKVERCLMVGGVVQGYDSYEDARDAMPVATIADEEAGADMLYSSGTTGKPKGVKIALPGSKVGEEIGTGALTKALYSFSDDMVYLSPAPLYHAAPLRFNMATLLFGGTSVIMEEFNEEHALSLIQKHRITHSQWVPTMFVKMLKLPETVRKKYDTSSLKVAIHAAAPCPIQIKEQMIDWWGPVIHEYYAGSEGNGLCAINSQEWLAHRGSVGRAILGVVHICDDNGEEVAAGEAGTIYFADGPVFAYHNDPEKTKESMHTKGWTTLGDVGRVDAEGFLYLTDRKAFMIISGGVNIYPQEAENRLIMHPKVADVAVFGVPNEDFGEEVKGVVQPMDWADVGPEFEAELLAFCQQELTKIKCPRSIDFDPELPRHPTGKLYKRLLRDRYWGNKDSKII